MRFISKEAKKIVALPTLSRFTLFFFQTADILTKTFIKSNTIQHNRIKQVYKQISIQI